MQQPAKGDKKEDELLLEVQGLFDKVSLSYSL